VEVYFGLEGNSLTKLYGTLYVENSEKFHDDTCMCSCYSCDATKHDR